MTVHSVVKTGVGPRHRGGSVAVAVAAVVAVTLLAAACPRLDQSGATATPGPTVSPVPVEDLNLEVIEGDVVARPDGTLVDLGLPGQVYTRVAARVPSGYVLEVVRETFELWFVPDGGPARLIGRLSSHWNWVLSPDGRTLVVSGLTTAPDRVAPTTAYQLPSLRVLGEPPQPQAGWDPIGVGGDLVLLQPLVGQGLSPTAVWNLTTGTVTEVGFELGALDLTDTGEVLVYLNRTPAGERVGCVGVVALPDLLRLNTPDRLGGTCSPELLPAWNGWISPDGAWAMLPMRSAEGQPIREVIVDVAQLRSGRLVPTPVVLSGRAGSAPSLTWQKDLWDTTTSVIVEELIHAARTGDYYRCETTGRCALLVMPDALPEARPVLRIGPRTS